MMWDRAAARVLAEKQAAAYARMLEIGEGVGGLRGPDGYMFQDMLAWGDSSENEHADTVLAALDAIDRVLALHKPTPYWLGEDSDARYDENGEEVDPEGYICLVCSDSHIEDDLDDWQMDPSDSGVAFYPCATVRALDGEQ